MEKFRLLIADLNFTKADFIRRRILALSDVELNKLDLKKMEFQWQTIDIMRDVHPKSLSEDEIVEAIKLKFERIN